MQLIIFGAPGAGKGTQAKILAQKLNIPHISTGDILRAAIASESDMGNKVKTIIDAGNLVPDDIMKEVIKDRFTKDDCKKGFILDGYPRTTAQADMLTDVLSFLGKTDLKVIKLDIEDQAIIDRLTSRRNCSKCNTIVNLLQLSDKKTCPNCSAEGSFIQRDDDTEEVIKNRLDVFERQTAPVLDYYKNKAEAEVLIIDASGSVEEINEKIMDKLLN